MGEGISFKPDGSRGIECYVNADFAGGWDKADLGNPEAFLSTTGHVLMYDSCPVLFYSKLQIEIALFTTEAEYIALSEATQEIIPLVNLLKEINEVFSLNLKEPKFHCKVFEDNNSCIVLTTAQNLLPRTKNIALKYHNFRQFVKNKMIEILEIFTKLLE